jgi:glycine oxidase
VIGLASAWRLTQRGCRVVIVDPRPAGAATHAAAGMLAPVSEVTYGETALLHVALESLRRYPDFVAELEDLTGREVGLRREGTLIAATDAGDRAMLADLHAFQAELGLTSTMLTSRECRSIEPSLHPDVRCGLLVASDHSVDNRRLADALLAAVIAGGATLVKETVAEICVDDNVESVTGIVTSAGTRHSAATVVLAAGPWSAAIAGLPAAARPPVRPVKGQILRLRPPTGQAVTTPLPEHSIRAISHGHDIYLVPRADGELVVGATVEDRGFDTTVRAGAVRELLRDARAVMPGIDELELVEASAALRPGSPDNRPIIGRTVIDNLVVATGHHRNGILLAPITADLVAGIVTSTTPAADAAHIDAVSPARLAKVPAGAGR